MSAAVNSAARSVKLEEFVAYKLLFRARSFSSYGALSPLYDEWDQEKSTEVQLSAVHRFIEKHLPPNGTAATVDLKKDQRIQELFDQALTNSVLKEINRQLEDMKFMRELADADHYLRATWDDDTWGTTVTNKLFQVFNPVRKAIDRSPWACRTIAWLNLPLARLGITAPPQTGTSTDEDAAVVFGIEELELSIVETDKTLSEKVTALMEQWKQTPSLPLQVLPSIKTDLQYIRDHVLPQYNS